MSGPRVLLMRLSIRESARGTEYLSGWLGAARVVGFKAKEPDKYGNEVWEIYAQEPQERDQAPRQQSPTRNAERGQAVHDRSRARAAGRARVAGEAVLREAQQTRLPEPPSDWLDDSQAAIADPERGR